ncbi:hypothetical protein CQW23_01753 [Capsicum baccatum]|uniref:Uncharacterized protein n=1 Tax=Capsicum baccatum TaxID=33114 RepID=A0A2G2XPI7_CAPBA|nr:hypothetical protein CQW23_01753 [Capsicum baccatum]
MSFSRIQSNRPPKYSLLNFFLPNSRIDFQSFTESNLAVRFLQDPLKETSENDNQFPEVTSKASTIDNEAKESPKKLIEKLSAALVSVSAKEDLVKQHAKVAEEAVAGVAEQSDDPDGNTNKQFPKEHDVDAAEQNANKDGNANKQSSNDHDIGVAEQSADQDKDTDEQVHNEQDVGATEKNTDQYRDANEQISDEQDLGAVAQYANQHEDINEQNYDQDGGTLMN